MNILRRAASIGIASISAMVMAACSGGGGSAPDPSGDATDTNAYKDSTETKLVRSTANNQSVMQVTFTRRKYTNRSFAGTEPTSEILLSFKALSDFDTGFHYTVQAISDLANPQYTKEGTLSTLTAGQEYQVGVIATEKAGLQFTRFSIELETNSGARHAYIDPDFASLLARSQTGGSGTGGGNSGNGQTQDCHTETANVAPRVAPPFLCGAPGPKVLDIMARLNAFWGSNVQACECRADFNFGQHPYCAGNAAVFSSAPGYIYYNPDFLQQLDDATGAAGPMWMLGHEMGHSLQGYRGNTFPSGKLKELSSDCLSGYFMASQACTGALPPTSVNQSINTACLAGDPSASPWFDNTAHGTCSERVQSTIRGIAAYNSRESYVNACIK